MSTEDVSGVEAEVPQVAEAPAPPETTSDEPAPDAPTVVRAAEPPEVPHPPSPVAEGESSSSSEPSAQPAAKRSRGRPTGAKNKPKIERVPVKKVAFEAQPKAPPSSPVQLVPLARAEGAPPPVPAVAPQLNLTDMLRETLRKMQAERQQQQSNLYANLARSGLR